MASLQKKRLGKSGLHVTSIGVGCAGLSGLHGEMDEEEAKQCILYALRRGINLIDTAPFYNERRSEILLGDILTGFPRQKLCVATKVGRYMNLTLQTESFDYSPEKTRTSVMESLRCMNLSYLDLVQLHDVEFASGLDEIKETISCLSDLKREGIIRSIGITGYSVRHLRHVAEHCHKDVDVIMSYFRHNLFDQSLQRDLAFYKAKDIGVINASPLAIGLLTDGGNVPFWNPAPEEVKLSCSNAANYCSNQKVSLSRLAIRHSMDNDGIAVTLWSSRKLANMKANIDDATKPLTPHEVQALKYVKQKIFGDLVVTSWEDKLCDYHAFWPIESN